MILNYYPPGCNEQAHPDQFTDAPSPSGVGGEATQQSPHTSATAHVLQRGESTCKETAESFSTFRSHVKDSEDFDYWMATGRLE